MGERMPRKKHSFRAAFLTGLVAIVLLGVGIFFGVRALVTGAKEPEMLFPDSVEGVTGELLPSLDPNLGDIKAGDYVYDGLIALVAKHDMPVFQTADELPDEMLLSFALWGALRGESYQSEIVDRPDGTRFLPQAVVERSLADHFVLTRTVTHQSVSVYTDFTYSAEEGGYTVWVTGVETRYLPRVQEIRSEGNRYQVTLDYVDLVALGEGELTPDTPSAKRVLLTLEGGGKEYKILSLALLSEGATE